MKNTYGEYLTFAENKYYIAANYVMYVGIVVLATSLLGCCCASMPNNRCMMALFVIFVMIVLVMDIVAGSLALVYREKVSELSLLKLGTGVEEFLEGDQIYWSCPIGVSNILEKIVKYQIGCEIFGIYFRLK